MATLTVRNLPPDVHDGLRRRAAENRRSVEAEVRELLRDAVSVQPPVLPLDQEAKKRALEALQKRGEALKARLPEGWSMVDELIAERRLEAAHESGVVSDDERLGMLERMHRFEAWPKEVQAFAEARLNDQA